MTQLLVQVVAFLLFLLVSATAVFGVLTISRNTTSRVVLAIAAAVTCLALYDATDIPPAWFAAILWLILIAKLVILLTPDLRQKLLIKPLFAYFQRVLPEMSRTEREALEAGTVWWEPELFCGSPDWSKLLDAPPAQLSDAERKFLDGPVEELCAMLDDWHITAERHDLPAACWEYMKRERFFGLILPEQYGGRAFSAYAHAAVVTKIASRSVTAAVNCMVPNSLGPGQLLIEYGTEAQRTHYLPRLATGEEIPCFALTGPAAGSDAASMTDTGIVCEREVDGKKELAIRLNWNKRYITLAPVATVMGLAFRLFDPDHLLGDEVDLGITLALIPTDLPGVEVGKRHMPLSTPFMNGPTRGKDVVVGFDRIIGGRERIGQGWRMLMECLSDGRGISLPSLSVAAGKFCLLHTGAYARIRRQFNLPIADFEGIQDPLATIAGNSYLMDATLRLTAATIDRGEKPAVASAISKYHLTERMRSVVNAAADIHGGSAICEGPLNPVARVYKAIPISITVEGANIITRSLIIFGQGSVRCHPWVLKEMEATRESDPVKALAEFDRAICGHALMFCSNLGVSLLGAIGEPLFCRRPAHSPVGHHFARVSHMSARFGLISDLMMLRFGGALKRFEFYSAHLGDLLSYLYLASAALKHYHDRGSPEGERPLIDWCLHECTRSFDKAMLNLLENRPFGRWLTPLIYRLIYPLGAPVTARNRKLEKAIANLISRDTPEREALLENVYRPTGDDPLAVMERAFGVVLAAEEDEKAYGRALKQLDTDEAFFDESLAEAKQKGLLDDGQIERIRAAHAARWQAIQVDEFDAAYWQPRSDV